MGETTSTPSVTKMVGGIVSICIILFLLIVGAYNIVFYSFKGYFDAMHYAIQLGVKYNGPTNAPKDQRTR